MKRTYKATFSNGQTVTRTSEHNYITAAAYINKETGELYGVMFSEKAQPVETRVVYKYTTGRIAKFYTPGQMAAAKAHNVEAARVWRWEVVSVQ